MVPLRAHSTLAQISAWFPIRHFITATFQSFNAAGASPWVGHTLLVMAIWGVGGTLITLRRFSWSPRRR